MKLEEKKRIAQDLHEKFSRSKVVIVTEYKGLDVAAISDLRKKLRESGIEYRVAKNTLLERASEGTEVALIKDSFKGPSAIALSYNDPVAPAKVLIKYAESNKKLVIKAGVLSGKVLDLNAIKTLSTMPPREVVLAQLLSAMNGVPTAFVRVLSEIPKSFLYVLQAIKNQKEAA
ncbi:MAG: 50S ribosomal protein L10 [Pseudomonadota bacterium]|nr:50S ribosomal protein L10 [Pseudomonadota bacterium]MBU1399285.1 50S ribosomal protein L10 [Pseudomonadota bacterium]MBU1569526.1 50S ribosomal protein L10 [Pseudomonadota bacterium]